MVEQVSVTHVAYDWMIVVYFFLGGVSAGAFMFSVAANYWWKQEFKALAKRAAILSLFALGTGMILLLAHLGRPERAWRVVATFNPHSMLSWGVWFLNIFGLMNLIYTGHLLLGQDESAKKFGYLGIIFALLTATYTAVHIARAPGMLLWHSQLMPVLFLNGAIITGIALVMLFSASAKNMHLLSRLGKVVAWLVILEISMLLVEVLMLLNGGTESIALAQSLLTGKIGCLFVGVEIVIGAIVPVTILLRARSTAFGHMVASILILIGIFTMRYVVIVGGQLIS